MRFGVFFVLFGVSFLLVTGCDTPAPTPTQQTTAPSAPTPSTTQSPPSVTERPKPVTPRPPPAPAQAVREVKFAPPVVDKGATQLTAHPPPVAPPPTKISPVVQPASVPTPRIEKPTNPVAAADPPGELIFKGPPRPAPSRRHGLGPVLVLAGVLVAALAAFVLVAAKHRPEVPRRLNKLRWEELKLSSELGLKEPLVPLEEPVAEEKPEVREAGRDVAPASRPKA